MSYTGIGPCCERPHTEFRQHHKCRMVAHQRAREKVDLDEINEHNYCEKNLEVTTTEQDTAHLEI